MGTASKLRMTEDATTATTTPPPEEVDEDAPQPAFKPELHSWIFIPESPTMRS